MCLYGGVIKRTGTGELPVIGLFAAGDAVAATSDIHHSHVETSVGDSPD